MSRMIYCNVQSGQKKYACVYEKEESTRIKKKSNMTIISIYGKDRNCKKYVKTYRCYIKQIVHYHLFQ